MLPASCSHRLLSVLNWALEECVEQKRLLELQIRDCRRLLGAWKSPSPDGVKQEISTASEQDNKPSADEQHELALLNRALEKALRIRNTLSGPVPGVLENAEGDTDRKSTTSAASCQAPMPKEKAPKLAAATPASRPNATKKPPLYTLHPPYRTNPDRKRGRGASAAAMQPPRSAKEAWRGTKRETALPKVLRSSSAGQPDQQHSTGASLRAGESLPIDGTVDRLLRDLEVDVPGQDADPAASESRMLRGAPWGSGAQDFTLKESGYTLKLPLPYRKALSSNERLWEKVLLCQTNSCAASETQFIEKMEATFDSVTPALSLAMMDAEVTVLRNTHTLLSQRMTAEAAPESAGPLTWEQEYQWLLTLEAIQAAVSQYLVRLQELRDAAKWHVRLDPGGPVGSTNTPQVDWLRLGKGRCLHTGSLSRPLLVYTSVQELKEIEAQKLRLGRLQQQLNIQKVLMAELIPLLESRSHLGPSLALPYRAIYTQLCEGGQKFPALVFDDLMD